MTRRPSLLLPAAFALLVACADSGFTSGPVAPEATDAEAVLRVDVYPPADADLRDARGQLLTLRPQTFYADVEPDSNAVLTLTPAIAIGGQVQGTALTPWLAQDLPELTRLLAGAEIGFNMPRTIQQPRATTTDDGLYDLLIVPDTQDYELTVVPATVDVPFIRRRVLVSGDQRTIDISIDAGAPVWGYVRDSGGRPLAGAQVRAVGAGGLAGPLTKTDAEGRYLLTVESGAPYTLVSLGRGPLDPTVRIDADVLDPVGLRVDIPYGDLEPRATITGAVRGPTGALVRPDAVRVRIVATELRAAPGTRAAYSREIGTDDGIFSAVVPPGTYRVEIFSRAPEGPAPQLIEDVTADGRIADIGVVSLRSLATRFAEVVDPFGDPVGGAVVTCVESGFGGRTWSSIADPLGQVALTSPEVPMTCTVAPPPSRPDLAATRQPITLERLDTDDDGPWRLEMVEGAVVVGRVQARLDARLDAPSTRPLAGALIEVRDGSDRLLGVGVSGSEGQFRLRVAR
jgi:hypothetical protein